MGNVGVTVNSLTEANNRMTTLRKMYLHVGSKVLVEMNMKVKVFWKVVLYS